VTAARVAVVGAGPAGLMAAERLASAGLSVTVHERMRTPGRKLLVAGRGGLNLTHDEPLDRLLERYRPAAARTLLEPAIRSFDPHDLRDWARELGQSTFVGTSRRVFPDRLLAAPLLAAWTDRLAAAGVTFRYHHTWTGWEGTRPTFRSDEDARSVPEDADAVVLALGGASWPRTGSDGSWVGPVRAAGVRVTELRPANCGLLVDWSATFRERFEGVPVKNVVLRHGARSARGEALVTAAGLEGGAVYALSGPVRDEVADRGTATIELDLRPDLTADQLAGRLGRRRPKDSTSTTLRRAGGLAPVAVGLMREATGNHLPDGAAALAALASAVHLTVTGVAPLEEAISTAGGIALDEVDGSFMLGRHAGVFVAGEMLDWEAPTGGYLLQATFSTAVAAAAGVVDWLAAGGRPPDPADPTGPTGGRTSAV
jgi:uncharacterized flavoprotein (TIGR03862 family)